MTGGARGLGEAIVRRLHAEEYRVVVADVDTAAAEALAGELDATGPAVQACTVDVADRDAPAELLNHALKCFGEVHVLVNNAARTQATPLMEIDPDDLEALMKVNFGGTFRLCQVFGAHFAGQGHGRIVNMASLAGQNGGTTTGAHYAASKGAVLTTTKVFARELASRGVTVNAVSPGPQEGDTVRTLVGGERLDALRASIPVGRLGDPAFVARTVALLASPEASSVTGACWDVNGGLYLR
ncbi:SDR family NAD(P)-dependent oxidoreductase [Amycolatopsis sp. NPDC004368]